EYVDPIKPAKVVKDALEKAVEKVADLATPPIPGAPGSAPPPLEEPTEPKPAPPRKADQGTPETRTATGARTGADADVREQQGEYQTTSTG
ncbi:catalase HPII, partial [Saccharothrix sp. MB29]|nr:catalase HPII [Saccharothrix sp. MB29]